MVKKPVVVIFSGGLDSTTLLYYAQKKLTDKEELYALSIDYGQRHRVELEHAARIASAIDVPHQVVDLRSITKFLGGSSQTDPSVPVPHGHYAEESMKATVVPNRNMIMLSVAIGYAESLGGGSVLFGAHAGDHAIYPDCRPEFARVMDLAAGFAGWNGCAVEAPFINSTKTDIAREAFFLGVPVADTWSCYEGGKVHCGKCGTCTERIEAIRDSGNQDPTVYANQTVNA